MSKLIAFLAGLLAGIPMIWAQPSGFASSIQVDWEDGLGAWRAVTLWDELGGGYYGKVQGSSDWVFAALSDYDPGWSVSWGRYQTAQEWPASATYQEVSGDIVGGPFLLFNGETVDGLVYPSPTFGDGVVSAGASVPEPGMSFFGLLIGGLSLWRPSRRMCLGSSGVS